MYMVVCSIYRGVNFGKKIAVYKIYLRYMRGCVFFREKMRWFLHLVGFDGGFAVFGDFGRCGFGTFRDFSIHE